jgi:hypothetical protein
MGSSFLVNSKKNILFSCAKRLILQLIAKILAYMQNYYYLCAVIIMSINKKDKNDNINRRTTKGSDGRNEVL